MPDLNVFLGTAPPDYVLAALSDDGRNAVDVTAGAITDIATPAFWLSSATFLLGYDPTDGNWDAVALEGGDVRNLRVALFDGAVGPADVAASAATLDETAATFLKTMTSLYAFGAADLDRLLAQGSDVDNVANVATGLLRTAAYNYGYDGAAWDRILAVAGAMVVTGPYEDEDAWTFGTSRVFPMGAVADDAVVDSLAEDQVGIPRMTLTRVLNTAATDPTTITQRQAVLAPAATLDETLARHATTAAALYGMGTADLERLITGSVGLATLQDTAGTGILPHVLMGVFDDVAAGATTENQFGALRMSAQRVLYTTAPAVQVDVNSAVVADVDAAVGAATGLRLIGFSARETAGATAQFHVVNGATGAAGTKITRVNLAANESAREWWWPGIDAASGISIDWVSGTIDIELYHLTLP